MENQTQNQASEKSKAKNTFGIISLILSIVAVLGCWIPFLNISSILIAMIGIIFGIWSFINVIRKKVRFIALPIIGVILSINAITIAIYANNSASKNISEGSSSSNSKIETNSATKEQSSSSEVGTDTTQKEEKTTEYKVGDIVSFGGMEFTVTKVQRNYSPSYTKPKAGQEFIKVSVKIENKSNSTISIHSPARFNVQDGNGVIESAASPTYGLDDQLEEADLAPGGIRSGSIIFEVPKNDINLKLIYQPSYASDKKIEVKL